MKHFNTENEISMRKTHLIFFKLQFKTWQEALTTKYYILSRNKERGQNMYILLQCGSDVF